MGILKLNELVNSLPGAVIELPISTFQGHKIAIDGYIWLNAYLAGGRTEVVKTTNLVKELPNPDSMRVKLYTMSLKFILEMLEYGIIPVFVFDPEVTHVEKKKTQETRRKTKLANLAKIRELYDKLDIDFDSSTMTLFHRVPFDEMVDYDKTIVAELTRRISNLNLFPKEEFVQFEEILRKIGIPCIRSKVEAEKLCVSLCLEGKVSAVMSTDTDALALGCPLMIRKKIKKVRYEEETMFECVRLDKVLEGLDMDQSSFLDLCICLGTDFNEKLKGLGTLKTFEHVKSGETDRPEGFIRTKEIFQYEPSGVEDPLEVEKKTFEELVEVLDLQGIKVYADIFFIRYGLMEKMTPTPIILPETCERIESGTLKEIERIIRENPGYM